MSVLSLCAVRPIPVCMLNVENEEGYQSLEISFRPSPTASLQGQ